SPQAPPDARRSGVTVPVTPRSEARRRRQPPQPTPRLARREVPMFDPTLEPSLHRPFAGDEPGDDEAFALLLRVRDPELVEELRAIADPREREAVALAALRIGWLALRTARGQVDAQTVRGEVERMLGELRAGLDAHRTHLQEQLERALREYFDPEGGRFEER